MAAGAAVTLLLTGLTWSPTLRAQLTDSVKRKPTPYTELYFSNHIRLPKVVELARPKVFKFVIANHEGGTKEYSYVVTERTLTESTVIDHDTVRVADQAKVERSVVFVPGEARPGYVISVQLLHRPEAIHFFADVR